MYVRSHCTPPILLETTRFFSHEASLRPVPSALHPFTSSISYNEGWSRNPSPGVINYINWYAYFCTSLNCRTAVSTQQYWPHALHDLVQHRNGKVPHFLWEVEHGISHTLTSVGTEKRNGKTLKACDVCLMCVLTVFRRHGYVPISDREGGIEGYAYREETLSGWLPLSKNQYHKRKPTRAEPTLADAQHRSLTVYHYCCMRIFAPVKYSRQWSNPGPMIQITTYFRERDAREIQIPMQRFHAQPFDYWSSR